MRAPYTPATISIVRESAARGYGVCALAAELGWTNKEVFDLGKRHGIEIADDVRGTKKTSTGTA